MHAARLARLATQAGRLPKSPPRAPEPVRRVTLSQLRKWKQHGQPIVMVTAYDYPSAVHADLAQVDMVLVGDSVAMVELGHETTQKMSVDQMVHHCQAVAHGAKRPFLVGDMPFGSYEVSIPDAMRTAFRFVKEGNVNAVKLEGGGEHSVAAVKRIVQSGIAVMGHTGLTPQSVSALGGFRSFGKTAQEAAGILEQALALQDAGAFAIVLECVPERVARAVTDRLEIPTIGIGAGSGTSGQVLVYHDMLGMLQHPHHAKVTPRFCKQYAAVGESIQVALETYADEVRAKAFPSHNYCPYEISDGEWDLFELAARSGKRTLSNRTPVRPETSEDSGGWAPY